MAVRRSRVDEAGRRARRQVDDAARALREARLAAGLRQLAVARALGVAHQLISMWERGVLLPDPIQFARWGAAVGRDVTLRVHVAGSPLRDVGHIRLLARARKLIGDAWVWRTEVPVSADPLDRRAFDAVLVRGQVRIGLELITRLVDAQGQIRQALLKVESGGLDCMILVLADTRHNRDAVREAAPYLGPSFPGSGRVLLAALRAGELPAANGIVFV